MVLREGELHPDELLEVAHRHGGGTLEESLITFALLLTVFITFRVFRSVFVTHRVAVIVVQNTGTGVLHLRRIRGRWSRPGFGVEGGAVEVDLVVLEGEGDGVFGAEELALVADV